MRKVLFKKWIPAVESPKYLSFKKLQPEYDFLYHGKHTVDGTGCYSDFIHEGLFHQWANDYEESTAGFGNYTVALIEVAGGTIEKVLPENVRFVESINEN